MLKYYLQQLIERLDGLGLPIRLGIFIGLYLVISLVFYLFLVSPAWSQISRVNSKISQAKNQKTVLQAHAKSYQYTNSKEQKKRIKELEEQLADIKEQLKQYKNSLLAPKHLASILKSILQQEPTVEVKRLQKKSSSKVTLKNNNKNKNQNNIQRMNYQIEYTGDYANTYNYLQRLKKLPWHIFWQSMTYRVMDYPTANVKLTIATLVEEGD